MTPPRLRLASRSGAPDDKPGIVSERVPPHDLDAEAAVLSAMLLSREAVDRVRNILESEHFYSDANGRIYEVAQELASEGRPVDITLVASVLRDQDGLAQIGGPSYLAQLADATPAVAHVEAHAERVFDKWRLRTAIATHQAFAARGYGDVGDVDQFLEDAARAVADHQREASRVGGGLVLGVRPLDVDELFAPLPPVDFLSKDLQWCAGRPATIVGVGGCGKTMAVQSAALSLASGARPIWNHFPVGRRARVLHMDHDNGTRATQRRYQRLAFGMGLSRDELRGYLRFVPVPKIRLTDPRARDLYRHAVDGFDFCVLDSLRGFTMGVDENDVRIRDCFDQVLMPVSEDTGCAFLVLHHMGKGGAQKPDNEAGRGSSGIFDGSGSQLRFTLSAGERVWGVDDGEASNAGGSGPELRRVTMAQAASESTGKDLAPFYLDFEDVPDNEAVDLKAGVRVVYRAEEQNKSARRQLHSPVSDNYISPSTSLPAAPCS
jgi:DnaB-like helicase N terminal domain/AAA domain